MFTQAARKHRIGRARVRFVMANTIPEPITTKRGTDAWLYIGSDDRGVEFEVIAVVITDGDLLVVHAMPTSYRGKE